MTNVFSAESLSSSYASVMPDWLTTSFFDSEVERHRLMVHQYQNSENVRKLRCFENLHLIEFRSQPLKSKENFESALSFLENSSLARYMLYESYHVKLYSFAESVVIISCCSKT